MNFFGLGAPELILILVIILIFFGKNKLPDLARSIGRSFRELKSGFENPSDTSSSDTSVTDTKKEDNKNASREKSK